MIGLYNSVGGFYRYSYVLLLYSKRKNDYVTI